VHFFLLIRCFFSFHSPSFLSCIFFYNQKMSEQTSSPVATPVIPVTPPTIINLGEQQYIDLVREVIETGDDRSERTGTGTFAKFGCQMKFDLRTSFPLLTTKKVFWKGVVEELLWFLRGSTNANVLSNKGVTIWDANASRQSLDKLGLTHREVGDLGPIYGWQWKHFGAKYVDMHTDYTGQGVDQLAELIHTIKHNPNDRRMILTAWNPTDLKQVALPACHLMCQFFVAKGELSCQLYQRSCDLGLGVPFNIASYALLTVMLAHVTGLKPGEFIHTMGDTHVYKNHVEALKTQIARTPRPFPTLKITREVSDIESFQLEDFEITGYDPYPAVQMEMSI